MVIEVPYLLKIPKKLLPIITNFNKYRYILLEGGRSSGKSQAFARLILFLADTKKLRVTCGREIQKSIEESVYTILKDLSTQYNLAYDILSTEIRHKTNGSTIHFKGFRDQGRENIKGLEGVDILWVEEAQTITKPTLDIIIPTIRKPKSRVFFSMNRYMPNDPVYKAFKNREDCLCIHMDYLDNEFCPEGMIHEAEQCKAQDEADYNHIWLGEPLDQGNDLVLSYDSVYNSPRLKFLSQGVSKIILAADIARYGDNETVFTVIKSVDVMKWEQIMIEHRKGWDLMHTTGYILELKRKFGPDIITVDDIGVGGGVTDRLKELKVPLIPFLSSNKANNPMYNNKRTEGYFKLKDMFLKGYLKVLNDARLLEQLMTVKFKYKSNGSKALITKEEMRKIGIKSPDRADALMMATSQIESAFVNRVMTNVQREAETEYNVFTH